MLALIRSRLGISMDHLRDERDRLLNPGQRSSTHARADHDNALNTLQRAETALSDAFERLGSTQATRGPPTVERARRATRTRKERRSRPSSR